MSTVIIDVSTSVDGFLAGPDRTADEPLGRGGERLHDWYLNPDARNEEILRSGSGRLGAMIAGRRTYDDSIRWWGADGPSGPARLPLIVLTHAEPSDSPVDGVYHFVTDGLHAALDRARAAAGGRDVAVMGGAEVIGQFLAADLVDEVSLHVAPVMFGGGTPLLGGSTTAGAALEPVDVVATGVATHLRYRRHR